MCTAMTLETTQGDVFFGRNMDFSHVLDPELYTVPRGYEWEGVLGGRRVVDRYAFMGIGQDLSPVVFADGVNEMGFGAAVLYFPGYARYDPVEPGPGEEGMPSIAATQLLHYLLGQCATVSEAALLLPDIRIVGVEDPVTQSVAPLHWIVADKEGGCKVIEKTATGLHIYDDPMGVLANSPDFPWQMTNLRNYMEAAPTQLGEAVWGPVALTPFGQGGGTFPLPGGYTPPARFVRTAFQKTHLAPVGAREEAVAACFHCLEGVSIPKGVVMTDRGAPDYTQYTAFMDLTLGEYYFRTYENSQIVSARLPRGGACNFQVCSLGKLRRPVAFERWQDRPWCGR